MKILNSEDPQIVLVLTPDEAATLLDGLTAARTNDDPAHNTQRYEWTSMSEDIADAIEATVPDRMQYGRIGGPVGRARECSVRGE